MKTKLIIGFLLIAIYTNATTYLIPIGTSQASANSTIASAVPGDSVKFQCGGTWAGIITVGVSGTSSNRIYIKSYGTGAKPILTTRQTLSGFTTSGNWTETSTGSHIWKWAITNTLDIAFRFWLDGVEYARSDAGTGVTSTRRTSYNMDRDNFLYLYATSNPATFYSNIETTGNNNETLYIQNANYITVDGLDIRGASGASIDLEFANHILIQNCNVGLDASKIGIRAVGTCSDVIIQDNTIDSGDRLVDNYLAQKALADGVWMKGGCHFWIIRRNKIIDWGHSGVEFSNFSSGDTTMTDIDVYNNDISAPDVDYCRAIGVDNKLGRLSTNIKVYFNKFHDLPVVSQINCYGLLLAYNIFNGVRISPTANQETAQLLGIQGYSQSSPQHMKIIGNVFANGQSSAIRLSNGPSYTQITGNEFINNIFFNSALNSPFYSQAQIVIEQQAGADRQPIVGNTFKNNIVYRSGISSGLIYDSRVGAFMSLSTWQASSPTYDTILNNVSVDPVLNVLMEPLAASPVFGLGLDLGTSYNLGLQPSSQWPSNVITGTQPTFWAVGPFVMVSNNLDPYPGDRIIIRGRKIRIGN